MRYTPVHDPATCDHCRKAQAFVREFLPSLLGDPRVIVSQGASGPFGPSLTTAKPWPSLNGRGE